MKFFDRIKKAIRIVVRGEPPVPPVPEPRGPYEDESGEDYRARVRKRERTEESEVIAQQIWDDTVSEIVENPEMEAKFKGFIQRHIGEWSSSGTMEISDVKAMINWLILNSNNYIVHDDVAAILDRIYTAMFQGVR